MNKPTGWAIHEAVRLLRAEGYVVLTASEAGRGRVLAAKLYDPAGDPQSRLDYESLLALLGASDELDDQERRRRSARP